MDSFFDLVKNSISLFDLVFFIFMIVNITSGVRNGFVASLISFSKWVIAFIMVKISLPELRPYMDGIIKSEILTDIILGTMIFLLTLFVLLLLNKGLKKTINWTGLGTIDTSFGFFFGIIKGYIYFASIFTIINFLHPYDRWSENINKGLTFNYVIWGNEFILDNFPKRYEYLDKSKKKLDNLK